MSRLVCSFHNKNPTRHERVGFFVASFSHTEWGFI